MSDVMCLARKVAGSPSSVLITGESGTGKELVTRAIHNLSPSREGLLVALNVAAIPETLIESYLFGHERGAFTGSVGEKEGLFEVVDGGTLFLDEIGEMPAHLQAKLLRVLETGEYRRVGGRKTLRTNARIICATNRNLGSEVADKTFREDLYYRVACIHIRIPSLRERLDDVPLLAEALLDRITESTGKSYWLSVNAMGALKEYQYPGNVRELRNILSVAAAHSPAGKIDLARVNAVIDCMKSRRTTGSEQLRRQTDIRDAEVPVQHGGEATLEDLEAQHIAQLLHQYHGNRRQVASALGVSERTMYRKLKRYGLT
mgnify:CR=1 FL=1